ncbi:MAG TPA: ammonium transporter [Pirellulales bacterium]|nr:ammonium transporter [Pirellulales bacterium]
MSLLSLRFPASLTVLTLLSALLACNGVRADEPGTPETNAAEAKVEEAAAAATATAEPPGFNKNLDMLSVGLDTVWVMIGGFLVMWMQAGFALVETGLTRAKNAVNICMKNLLDYCFGSIAYWAVGFGLMFSIGNSFVGDSGFMLKETPAQVEQPDGTMKETTNFDPISWTAVPLEAKFFFQLVFAATAATIVSGAMAERTKFLSYMVYSIVISLVIYPISGHWIWGGGWLAQKGFFDFAGSTVVHSLGGWLSLVGAFVLGPRLGKFDAEGKPKAIPGHNLVLVTLGVFILWLGWFGFNPGSTMAADGVSIAHITCTTNAAGAVGGILALFTAKAMFGKWDASMALNGVLAGLVAITAPCMWVSIPSAIIIGGVAGVLVVLSVVFIEHTLKIDDPVGAISVHGVCGAWGTLSLGLFSIGTGEAMPKPGLFTGGNADQLVVQAIGVGSVFLWALVTGAICFYGIKLVIGLRVTPEEEAEGLDFGEHGNEAYHGFQFIQEA